MIKQNCLVLALAISCAVVPLRSAPALAQNRIPPLAFIPNTLQGDDRAKLSDRRQALQAELTAFQAAAAAFNALPAERQTDADYNALQARRAAYISAANAFNADLAKVIATETTRASLIAGVAAAVRGTVSMQTGNGDTVIVSSGTKIPLDGATRIVSGSNGRLQILLPDETIFTLGPSSDMVLDDYVYDPKTAATGTLARLSTGTFRFVTGKIAPKDPDRMRIKVAVGTIGVRGTDIEVTIGADGAGYILLRSGAANFAPANGSSAVDIAAGQMISFDAAGKISAPTPFRPGDDPQ